MKIVHLTSAHPRYDTRIFLKQCQSLSKANYSVSLIVADGKGDKKENNINIFDVGLPQKRLDRIFKTTRKVFQKAISLDADIYHLHDPELIPIGLKLKKQGKIVIFDSHEDVPVQIRSKPYLISPLRYLIGHIFSLYEKYSCKKMNAVIAATPFIRDKFLTINPNTIDINNFPIFNEIQPVNSWKSKQNIICYIGGIEAVRGIREIVIALETIKTKSKLQLAGSFSQRILKKEVKTYKGWEKIEELGYLNRDGVKKVLERSVAGLVTLHPIENYIDALPVKMFEYMSSGIPVIASNFPLWKEIIEKNNCGLCVDPLDPKAIAEAIDFLIDNPIKAQEMGSNGRKAILKEYNWGIEEQKLISLYSRLSSENPSNISAL